MEGRVTEGEGCRGEGKERRRKGGEVERKEEVEGCGRRI